MMLFFVASGMSCSEIARDGANRSDIASEKYWDR
jgi:hypothetical protein